MSKMMKKVLTGVILMAVLTVSQTAYADTMNSNSDKDGSLWEKSYTKKFHGHHQPDARISDFSISYPSADDLKYVKLMAFLNEAE